MRTAALIMITLSQFMILILTSLEISASSLSLFTTLITVVVFAFAASALLRNIKSMSLSRNYMISGIIGVVIGIIYFIWAGDNLERMVLWMKDFGIYFLMALAVICAFILFFSSNKKDKKTVVSTSSTNEEQSA